MASAALTWTLIGCFVVALLITLGKIGGLFLLIGGVVAALLGGALRLTSRVSPGTHGRASRPNASRFLRVSDADPVGRTVERVSSTDVQP